MMTFAVIALTSLAACADEVPTVTPTAELSGPTLEASPTFFPDLSYDSTSQAEFIGQSDPTAAALAPDSALPPLSLSDNSVVNNVQSVEITADDGTQLVGELYISPGERMPGLVLIAPEGASWGDLPTRLNAAGFTVLLMPPRDGFYVEDLRVMMLSLSTGMAQPDHLAAIGADVGADMALLGCAAEPLCDAAVLLSPSDDSALSNAINTYNPRPIFLTASQEDVVSFSAITTLQSAATGPVFFQPFQEAGHGTALVLNRPDLGDVIIEWLHQQVG